MEHCRSAQTDHTYAVRHRETIMKQTKVAANFVQDFTEPEKAQARSNIGAQAQLTAGSNVSITNNVISATDTTYTAGTGINIANNVISATGGVGGGVFIATYNSTTYAEISAALSAGDSVVLRYGGADIPISSSTASRHAFLQVRRDGHSYAQQTDSTRAFLVESDDTWSMNTAPVAYNIIAGAGLTYAINDNDITLAVSASFMPDLQLLQSVTVDVGASTTNTLNIENGKSYFIRITGSVSPIITLSTTSTTTIHSLIAVKNTSATACADVTIRFRDETGYAHDIQLMMYETSAEYDFYVDIRNLGSSVVARVYDMPCMYRKGWQGSAQYTNDTAWIGYVR